MTRSPFLFLTATLVLQTVADVTPAQSFQSSGVDFSPGMAGGKVVTSGHDDANASNPDVPNFRVSAYSFDSVPGDPNFTQDPGFNTPANGLPAGDTLSFGILDGLTYWNGAGAVALGKPANGESLGLSFGSQSRTLTGTSGAQPGFNIGAVTSDGALHKHLNAFLFDSLGRDDSSATPTAGVYVAQLRLNDTSLASSDPLFVVYDKGAPTASADRAKFYVRNNFAPGSALLKNTTSMIGLSAQPGEANLATGGAVTVTPGGPNGYASEVDDLTANANKGSVVIGGLPASVRTVGLLYLTGTSGDVTSLIARLDVPEAYDIAPASAASTDPLYGDIQKLRAQYPGFSAIVEFDPAATNGAFTWDFSADTNVVVDRIAFVPEPASVALLGVGGLALRRRRV